ncbi:MAG: hypothetical protein HOP33_20775 [Verrucomicrobia bacterium]|nr:hypothetical protein [Verrucomicrobiota bacterium]
MAIPILDDLERLIVEHGSATVRGDHIALLREQREGLEKKVADLQSENGSLKEEIRDLREKLKTAAPPNEFIKYRGVLFRRLPTGVIEDAVYCWKCRGPMVSMKRHMPYQCTACNITADFTVSWLPEIMKEAAMLAPK